MSKFFIVLLLFLNGIFSAQIISGTVFKENETPLAEVNIYVDGSQIHSTSGIDGNFSIDIQNQKNTTLVFQKNGYETNVVKTSELVGKKVKVILMKVQEIEEVVLIPYTDEAYRKFINYFLDQFIGFNQNKVTIKNQKSLQFSFDKKNQILKVKAPQTLIINNKNLAYQIQYNLVNFQADFKNKTTVYSGTSYFKEVNTKKINQVNRLNAYHGSIMHFLRSVYQDQVAEEGFWVNHIIKPDKKIGISEKGMMLIATKIPTKSFLQIHERSKILEFKDILQVNYLKHYYEIKKSKLVKAKSSVPQTSYIYVEGNSFEIYPDGNSSDPENMLIQGNLSGNKMEVFLPLDYQPILE